MSPNISGTLVRRGCLADGVIASVLREYCALYCEICVLLLLEGIKLGDFSGELSQLLTVCSTLFGTRLELRFKVLILSFRFRWDFRLIGISGAGELSGVLCGLSSSCFGSVTELSVFEFTSCSASVFGSKSCSMPLSSLSSPHVELSR